MNLSIHRRNQILAALAGSVAVLSSFSCKGIASGEISPAATGKPAAPNPLEIRAASQLLQQLKLGDPAWAEISTTQIVPARLELDDTRVTRVGSPVMGRITSLSVQEGQEVHRGDVLAQLNSTGLSDAQLGFLKAVSQKLVASRAVERAQVLLKADVIGSAELQRREAELAQASAEMDAARDQLEILGMPNEAIDDLEKTRAIHSVSRVVAGIDGTVLSRKITLGQVIQPADTILEISDLSSVWLVADVPEQTAGNLRVGQTADAEIAAIPGARIHSRLSFVSATVNPETRTVRVRMDLRNPQRRFKPSMLATMTLRGDAARQRVVPSTAVVREDNNEHVFVQLNRDTFVLRQVKLDGEFEGKRVVLEGIRPGEKIVLDGAFHLNNERRRQMLRGSEGG